MNKTFKTKVNATFDFEISSEHVSKLDTLQISESKFHILEEHKSFQADIQSSNFNSKNYNVIVNGNTYNVQISDQLDVLINEMGFALGSTKHVNSIKAPMPGLILDINVKEGQEVEEDTPLLILEAMKMENVITSPRNGVIKSITAKKGDAVEKNELLIEFDS
ncbi:acetyl-CoA carboxylase biotin carboxyl carrier protein subunit [Seonamhaeicola marinus]|uniref:Biotin/lipoyl-binding protein n=1 Tax=Seonamhaeicola marinus TaxID=1912246 RepID=A0A5D0HJS9_9FLAO|nr:acetyl-CoA carboxylase biotin carboxyl carrier protein subunit [Seonamhaeicola marinus]TYA71643.1 biotin/lipoyl-binding protein [Seonamhaeicola marinus]